jgi:hypothetical protein
VKKFVGAMLCLVLVTLLVSGFAAGKLSVVQETFYVLPYIDYHAGYVYAEVKNIGDKPVEFNGGLIELYDAEGNSIESSTYLRMYPKTLDANEIGYLYVSQSVKEATDQSFIDDYLLTVTGKGAKENNVLRLPVAEAKTQLDKRSYWSYYYVLTNLTNNTDQVLYDFEVVYALKNAEGKLLYVTQGEPSYVGLLPGSSIQMRLRVDSDIVEKLGETEFENAVVEAIAFVEVD